MRNQLSKAQQRAQVLDMMYMAKDGAISKRRVRVLCVGASSFQAYCYLRRAKRTFAIERVLALVPIVRTERLVV